MADITKDATNAVKSHPFITIGGLAIVGLALYMIYKNNASSGNNQQQSGQYYVAFVDESAPFSAGGTGNQTNPPGILPPGPSGGVNPPGPTPAPSVGPLIPFGRLPPGTRYSTAADLAAQPFLTWNGVKYKKVPGANGRLWGIDPSGKQVLLYEPASFYPATSGR